MTHRLAPTVLVVAAFVPTLAAAPQDLRELYQRSPHLDRLVTHLVTGDLDGDGVPELVESSETRTRTWRWVDGGLAPLQTVLEHHSLEFRNGPTLPFDFENDGDLDAFCTNRELLGAPQPHDLLLNDGAGVLTELAGAVPGEVDFTESAAVADLNGDALPEVLSVTKFLANEVYFHTGSGFATIAPAVVGLGFLADHVVLGDVDLDGDVDALLGDGAGSSGSQVFLNAGNGTFATGASFPQHLGFALADLDGDGDLDVLADRSPLFNDGGSFTAGVEFVPAALGREGVLVDVDGDGDLDATFLDPSGGTTPLLFEHDGTGGFAYAAERFEAGGGWGWPAVLADLDGDADTDVLTAGLDRFELHRGDGEGYFGAPSEAGLLVPGVADAVALADVDADGFPDLLRPSPGALHVALGTGTGRFGLPTGAPLSPQGQRVADLDTGDLDGDGDLDVYVAYHSRDTSPLNALDQVLRNAGDGTFPGPSEFVTASPRETFAVALGDLDADGDLDALLGAEDGPVKLTNALLGAFLDETTDLPALDARVTAVELADLDGDGDLDAVLATEPSRVLWNDGTGTFASGPELSLGAAGLCLAIGDADSDGDVDVFLGALGVGASGLHRNQGGGAFVLEGLSDPSYVPRRAAFLDLDDDDVAEVLLASATFGDGDAVVRWNGTSFDLVAGALGAEPYRSRAFAVADLELDGDVDVVLVHDSPSVEEDYPHVAPEPCHVLTNVRRQLAWERPARLGGTLRMGLEAEPGAPWLAAWDFSAQATPLPPFGTLRLPLPSLKVAGQGLLDGAGRATLDVPLPSSTAFHGLPVYWQALLGSPTLGFSNLELTTLSRF